jgi:hypothetical protein
VIVAPSPELFRGNYLALLTDLIRPTERTLRVVDTDEYFSCYYKSSRVSRVSLSEGSGVSRQVWCEFDITLCFVSARPGQVECLLADDRGNVIVTEDSSDESGKEYSRFINVTPGEAVSKPEQTPDPEPTPKTLAEIPVGTNIRGWRFRITNTDIPTAGYDFPDNTMFALTCNDAPIPPPVDESNFIGVLGGVFSEDLITIIGSFSGYTIGIRYGTWIPEGTEFTIPNDKDYIVTSNNLPTGDETRWGFENIIIL